MLLEFGFKNYFSFREGASVSFRLDGNVPDKISGGRSYATAMCIKGANASGKTNVLRAISFLCQFALDSFSSKPESGLNFASHFDSAEPSEFYVEFQVGDSIYLYELFATENEVLKEEIYRTKGKKIKIISREGEKISCIKSFDRLKTMKLRKNVSLISHARQHEYIELSDIYDFFENVTTNVNYGGLVSNAISDEMMAKLLYNAPKDVLNFITNFISECDTGVKDIRIFMSNKIGENSNDYFPIFYHGENMTRPLTIHTESSGTKALFRRLGLYAALIDLGGIIIADEVDIHLHPHVLQKLLGLFLDPDKNTQGAQIIFTAHNSEVMDLLGRYRTCLVQKEENESFLYRLDEIGGDVLRNDRLISPSYNDGKIGGIPKL